MGTKKKKVKKKCCEKYLKSGKHCKDCPLLVPKEVKEKKEKGGKKKTAKKIKDKKKKK